MVGNLVVTVRDTDLRKAPAAAIVSEEKGGDARGIRLETERHHLIHHADVITIRNGNTVRPLRFGNLHAEFLGIPDTHLDIPHSGQIFIHLSFVGGVEASAETLGVINNKIQDAFLFRTAHLIEFLVTRAKEFFEDHAGIALCGSGGAFAPPRQIELVCA